MQREQAGFDAAFLAGFEFGFRHPALFALVDELLQFGIVARGLERQRMLRRNRKIGHAHQGVGPRGEDFQRLAALDVEADLQAFRAPQPVALHDLDGFRPAGEFVKTFKQFIGIRGDLEKPLRNLALLDHRAGAPAAAVHHLLVGQHGLVHRVPVHHAVLAVHQALPEQPHEHALLVHVIGRIAGGELARPVDRETHRLQLPAHVHDVLARPLRGRDAALDRGVLGRQPERIPGHRLQDIPALHPLETADHVADGVVAHVAHVQRTGRIRQHRQAIVFRARCVLLHLERAGVGPELLRGGFHGAGVVGFLHGGGATASGKREAARLPQRSKAAKRPRRLRNATFGLRQVGPVWL